MFSCYSDRSTTVLALISGNYIGKTFPMFIHYQTCLTYEDSCMYFKEKMMNLLFDMVHEIAIHFNKRFQRSTQFNHQKEKKLC